jgi:hypothetical protein
VGQHQATFKKFLLLEPRKFLNRFHQQPPANPLQSKSTRAILMLYGIIVEQRRILKLFHDNVVPHLVAAMFEAQFVKEELESRGLQEGEALSRLIERLVKAVY